MSVFKVTIKEWFKDDFRLIRDRAQFFSLALMKSDTFLGHPVEYTSSSAASVGSYYRTAYSLFMDKHVIVSAIEARIQPFALINFYNFAFGV